MAVRWLMSLVLLAGCRTVAGSPALVVQAEAEARRSIAEEQSLSPARLPERSIAVIPLSALANDETSVALAYGLADLLTTDLAFAQQLVVVERIRTDALLRELKLAASGAVDSATAPRVGLLAGARQLVVGAVSSEGTDVRLNVRLADVATSGVRPVASVSAPLDAVFDLEKSVAFRLLEELRVSLTPAQRAAIDQRPTRNVGALLAYGRGARAEAVGDFRAAEVQYRQAATLDPNFQRAAAAAVRSAGVTTSRAAIGTSATRAAAAAGNAVNQPMMMSHNAAADAAFPLRQLITIGIIVAVP